MAQKQVHQKQVMEHLKQKAEWLQDTQLCPLPKLPKNALQDISQYASQDISQNTSQNIQGVLPLDVSTHNGESKRSGLDTADNWQHYSWRLDKRSRIIGLEGVRRAKQALHAGNSSLKSDTCMPDSKFEHKAA